MAGEAKRATLFKFKQFDIDQKGSTMKINTDGVLLGAIAGRDAPHYILDIGTGTGVIAMMLAQKYEKAFVDAVEIDEQSHTLAYRNFNNSKFATRLRSYHGSFELLTPKSYYQLIVSNPPYFVNALKNPDLRKSNARHTSFAFYENLFLFSVKWLAEDGTLQLILPVDIAEQVIKLAKETFEFFHVSSTFIKSFEASMPFRQIVTFSKQANPYKACYFTIYEATGIYTEQYKTLLSPYFLNF